jgi:hypothetical protein
MYTHLIALPSGNDVDSGLQAKLGQGVCRSFASLVTTYGVLLAFLCSFISGSY